MSLHPPSYHILQSVGLQGIDVAILSDEEANVIRTQVIRKFASYPGDVIWQNLLHFASVQNPDGWKMIDGYLAGTSFILFFDEIEDKTMIEFPAGTNLSFVLKECPGFEFYTTNRDAVYLLCFNHHDFLIASGKAMKWVASQTFRS